MGPFPSPAQRPLLGGEPTVRVLGRRLSGRLLSRPFNPTKHWTGAPQWGSDTRINKGSLELNIST